MRTFSWAACPLKQPQKTTATSADVDAPVIETDAVGFAHPAVSALNELFYGSLATAAA
jgi:hypothetical protein